ncbi:hypothetical protein ACUONA_24910, partial [Escherichia coli]
MRCQARRTIRQGLSACLPPRAQDARQRGRNMAAPDSAIAIAQAELAARVAMVGMRASAASTAALAAEVDS